MQSIPILITIALLVLTVPAGAAPPEDQLLTIPVSGSYQDDENTIYYVSVCRVNQGELGTLTVKANECFESGIWEETNQLEHLQSRSGLDGTQLYSSDNPVLL